MLAAPAVAVLGAAVLQRRAGIIYWGFCCASTSTVATAFYLGNQDPGPPFNAPSALAAVLVVVPMVVTFGVERLWLVLGRTVSRPLSTTILSLPLGLLTYFLSLFVALWFAVGVGILWP